MAGHAGKGGLSKRLISYYSTQTAPPPRPDREQKRGAHVRVTAGCERSEHGLTQAQLTVP